MHRITKEFHFSASHQLCHLPADHKCARLHGHNYIVGAELDADGFVPDFSDLSVLKHLTHPIQEKWLSRHLAGRPQLRFDLGIRGLYRKRAPVPTSALALANMLNVLIPGLPHRDVTGGPLLNEFGKLRIAVNCYAHAGSPRQCFGGCGAPMFDHVRIQDSLEPEDARSDRLLQ